MADATHSSQYIRIERHGDIAVITPSAEVEKLPENLMADCGLRIWKTGPGPSSAVFRPLFNPHSALRTPQSEGSMSKEPLPPPKPLAPPLNPQPQTSPGRVPTTLEDVHEDAHPPDH